MSEKDSQGEDRSLPASETRIKEAREEGRVARSRDLTSALLTLSAVMAFAIAGPALVSKCTELVGEGLRFGKPSLSSNASMGEALGHQTLLAGIAIVPLLAILAAASMVASLALGGWNFTMKPTMPDFSKLNPATGLGRVFSKTGLAEMTKSSLLVTALSIALYILLSNQGEEFAQLAALPFAAALAKTGNMMIYAMYFFVGILAVSAAIDVPLQIWRHNTSLKMTLQEVRRESRENDGDPQVKGRIRNLQREAARRRMMEAVPTADVVLTNPTHFAVAISYSDKSMRAPTIVAKGADLVGFRIRALALENGVPVVEQPALARALHFHADIGDEVPVALYGAVARVLAWVYQMKTFVPGKPPAVLETVEIPAGLDPNEASQ